MADLMTCVPCRYSVPDERRWTIHKRSGEWDDVIEGPDAEEVAVRPASLVAALQEDVAAGEAMYGDVLAALEEASVPFTGPPEARGWLPHLCAADRVAALARERDAAQARVRELEERAGISREHFALGVAAIVGRYKPALTENQRLFIGYAVYDELVGKS